MPHPRFLQWERRLLRVIRIGQLAHKRADVSLYCRASRLAAEIRRRAGGEGWAT